LAIKGGLKLVCAEAKCVNVAGDIVAGFSGWESLDAVLLRREPIVNYFAWNGCACDGRMVEGEGRGRKDVFIPFLSLQLFARTDLLFEGV
jgi:hypothetical protein